MVCLIPKHFRYSRQHFVIYNNPGIVEYGEFNTETLSQLKVTLRDLKYPGIDEYGEFDIETLPLLKVTLRDLQ